MTDATRGPARRDPFDGLKPADFFTGPWPLGSPVTPKALSDYGLTETQLSFHLLVVDRAQELAMDYNEFLTYTGKHHEDVAEELGLGLNALRDFRLGNRFPSFRTYGLLRAYIPTHDEMEAQYRPRRR